MNSQLVEFFGANYWQQFQLSANVSLSAQNEIQVEYQLTGPVDEILIPTQYQGLHRRTEGLWQQTCFEFFIAEKSKQKYFEFNFSPDTSWDAYQFDEYRKRSVIQDEIKTPQIELNQIDNPRLLKLSSRIVLPQSLADKENYECSVTTVLKNKKNEVGYWAVQHAGEKPDFHLRNSFTGIIKQK